MKSTYQIGQKVLGTWSNRRKALRTGIAMIAVSTAGAAALPAIGHAAPPPPIVGEIITSYFEGPDDYLTAQCNPSGNSTIQYRTSGSSTGVYSGTYTETGTFVIGPQTPEGGPLVSHTATFTITAPNGTVTGQMDSNGYTLSDPLNSCIATGQPGPSAAVSCQAIGSTAVKEEQYDAYADEEASAVISVPEGNFNAIGRTSGGPAKTQYTCANGQTILTGAFLTRNMTLTVGGVVEPPVDPQPLPDTDGKTTGGGKLAQTVNFNVSVQRKNGIIKGSCVVKDSAITVDCKDILHYNQTGNTATFSGNATVNGAPTTFTIVATDNGEPGNQDTLSITTSSGYSRSGTVTSGNIQVHK